jgi:hypothetical protein
MKEMKLQLLCQLKSVDDEIKFNKKLDELCKQFTTVILSSDCATDNEDKEQIDNFVEIMTKTIATHNNIEHLFSEQVKAVLNVILTAGVGEKITLADADREKDIIWERIK